QTKDAFEKLLEGKTSANLTERALRYDLTIPFARYIAMNYGQLTFPFKRYQIQPVWRADRPQRGRYREFYQCDADVAGSKSLWNEIELAAIYSEVFKRLKIDVEIKINSRKIFTALAETIGGAEKLTDITIAIDKIDKIGIEKVKLELTQRGLTETQVNLIEKYLSVSGNNKNKIAQVKNLLGENINAQQGIEELEYVLNNSSECPLAIDFTLARGLNYYTGIIFEAKAKNISIGSIGGGGRYDDLTGLFDVPNISGVGISFGVDRIYDVMEELQLFPKELQTGTQILFFNLGEKEAVASFKLMQQLRNKGLKCELYHEAAKMDKQFKYAVKKNIQWAIIIGAAEIEKATCNVKNLETSEQKTLLQQEMLTFNF
ncbi:MAG: histidine--tRNA ligase, partial [Chitinophagaceae bacterium]|nr:histidine--tRNA ligase [Chitinophagaceae bacterium]